MRLGIGSYSYGWAVGTYPGPAPANYPFLTAADLIDRAVQLDVSVVQICVRPDLATMDENELATIRRDAEEGGVALEVGTMGSDADHLLDFLRIASELDARLVRTIFTQPSPGLVQERQSVERIEPQYAAAGVTLAIENYEMAGYDDLRVFVQGIDSEHVGVCLDTVNSLGRGEGVREVTDALMPYTKCLHVKDFRVVRNESNMAFAVVGAPAGEGLLDVSAQMRMLASVHPEASVILEQWTPFQGDFERTVQTEQEWAKRGIAHIKAALVSA